MDENNAEGRNAEGRNAEGRNAEGRNAEGRNAEGRNAEGRNAEGHNAEGHNAEDHNAEKPKELDVVNIERMAAALEQGSLTEAKIKFETPGARQAREKRETADADHERLLAVMKLGFAGFLMIVFVSLGIYLFAFKPNATETQKLYASTVLTAIASGSAGYAFGKKQDKPEKE